MKRLLFAVVFSIVFLSSAVLHAGRDMDPLKMPRVDLSPFLAVGCVDNDQAKGFVCPAEVLRRFKCSELSLVQGLGGFDMPVALCVLGRKSKARAKSKDDQAVAYRGCMLRVPLRYVIYTTKGFWVTKSPGELVKAVSPIDSAEKAASLVMALDPNVFLNPPAESKAHVLKTRDKKFLRPSAAAVDGGFAVRLFERTICGCGLHPVFAVDYRVSANGDVSEISRKLVMEGLEEICVD